MKSEIEYNAIAAKVMMEQGIPINDMYSHVLKLIDMDKPASHGADPFYFDRKPLYPPIVVNVLQQLDLIKPVQGPVQVFIMAGGWSHIRWWHRNGRRQAKTGSKSWHAGPPGT